jgi:hypothetical protein
VILVAPGHRQPVVKLAKPPHGSGPGDSVSIADRAVARPDHAHDRAHDVVGAQQASAPDETVVVALDQ